MKYVEPGILTKWIAQKQGFVAKYPQADREKLLALRRKLIKALHDGGVPFALDPTRRRPGTCQGFQRTASSAQSWQPG